MPGCHLEYPRCFLSPFLAFRNGKYGWKTRHLRDMGKSPLSICMCVYIYIQIYITYIHIIYHIYYIYIYIIYIIYIYIYHIYHIYIYGYILFIPPHSTDARALKAQLWMFDARGHGLEGLVATSLCDGNRFQPLDPIARWSVIAMMVILLFCEDRSMGHRIVCYK